MATQLDWKQILKTFAKASGIILFNVFFFTALGLIISITAFFWALPGIRALWIATPPFELTGLAYLYFVFIFNWQSTYLFILFTIVFPVVYFLLAKSYSIKKAMVYVYQESSPFLAAYLTKKVFEYSKIQQKGTDLFDEHGVFTGLDDIKEVFAKKLQGIPFVLKGMFRYFMKKFNFFGVLEEVVKEDKINKPDMDIIAQNISKKTKGKLDQLMQPPNSLTIWLLYTIHTIAVIVINVYL